MDPQGFPCSTALPQKGSMKTISPANFVQISGTYYDPISFNPGPKMLFVIYKSSGKRYSSISLKALLSF